MRLGPLVALVCLVGCKTQAGGSTAPVETTQTADEGAAQAGAADEAQPSPTGSTEETVGSDPERHFCEKLTALMVAERGAEPGAAGQEELVETCVANAHRKRVENPATFKREVECISDASELGAFFDCALDPPAPQATGENRFLPLCEKLAELAKNEPGFPEEMKAELQDTARCAADAQLEHNAAPREFERVEACILAAAGMQDVAVCTGAGAPAR